MMNIYKNSQDNIHATVPMLRNDQCRQHKQHALIRNVKMYNRNIPWELDQISSPKVEFVSSAAFPELLAEPRAGLTKHVSIQSLQSNLFKNMAI